MHFATAAFQGFVVLIGKCGIAARTNSTDVNRCTGLDAGQESGAYGAADRAELTTQLSSRQVAAPTQETGAALSQALSAEQEHHLKDAVHKLGSRLRGTPPAAGDIVHASLLAVGHWRAVQHFWVQQVRGLAYHLVPQPVRPVKPAQQRYTLRGWTATEKDAGWQAVQCSLPAGIYLSRDRIEFIVRQRL